MYQYYSEGITNHGNRKLNSTVNLNSGNHALTHDKMIQNPFNENNVAVIKTK